MGAVNIPWGLVAFVIGLVYGLVKAGKQDKSQLLKQGLIIGLVIGIILALIGFLFDYPILGVAGFIAIVWGVFVLTLLFILGVWLGDLLSGAKRGR